jgi:hypothetical protein
LKSFFMWDYIKSSNSAGANLMDFKVQTVTKYCNRFDSAFGKP